MSNIRIGGTAGDGSEVVSSRFFHKLKAFTDVGAAETASIGNLVRKTVSFASGEDIIRAGDPYGPIYILNEGWAIRYRVLDDGRRQVANIILPGDFMCLNAIIFKHSECTISTLTPVTCAVFQPADIVQLTRTHPLLCAAIFWCNAREEALIEEHLVSVGRRNARERIAHLLVELWHRQKIAGLLSEGSYTMPLTQELIADCLGLTPVYVNRLMRELTDSHLISCRRNPQPRLHVDDIERLEKVAGYEDGYLHFTEIPNATRKELARL
jgi:CRP-like cAMP-binding protein